jgi:hypothetical protein
MKTHPFSTVSLRYKRAHPASVSSSAPPSCHTRNDLHHKVPTTETFANCTNAIPLVTRAPSRTVDATAAILYAHEISGRIAMLDLTTCFIRSVHRRSREGLLDARTLVGFRTSFSHGSLAEAHCRLLWGYIQARRRC